MEVEDEAAQASATRLQPFLFAGVCVVATAARLMGINFNLAEDEIFSVQLDSHSFQGVVNGSLVDKPHPPLYNFLLHFWIVVFGSSEVTVRLLTVILAVGAIAIYFHILRALVRPFVAVCGALVMGLSGFLIYYGQESRPYGLIALVGAANIWTFLRVLKEPESRNNILAWTASALLFVYAQYFGAVYLVVEGMILLLYMPLKLALRTLAPAVLASFCVIPWMWIAFHTHWKLTEIGWIEQPDLRSLPDFFIGAVGYPPVVSGWLLLAAVAALFIVSFRRVLGSGRFSVELVTFVALAFVPACIAFVLSYLLGFSVWAPRQLITSAFAFIVLLACLVDSLPLVAARVVAGGLVLWAAAGASDGYPSNYVPRWPSILGQIARRDNHALVLGEEGWILRPLQYYGPNLGLRVLDLQDTNLVLPDRAFFYVCRPPFCQRLPSLERQASRVGQAATYPWGNPARNRKDVVVVYLLAPPAHPVRKSGG